MNEAIFENQLSKLVREIGSVPEPKRKKLIKLIEHAGNCHKQLRKSVATLQESLDYLRVSVKYLIFDLEATRRENLTLKKMLGDNNR